ncbi:M14 metallopeptidase family protein [Kangiella aquimarina]|uniref:M14 family metallopeptidase n=1 Tax=Kangiella aquimarina TaxID=261965 RepID=A0ABZ0X6E8_9GAMM|nr:M14 metallopeptidase family protein [Kangiella aquimarina]WQG86095.1 M14 family metallopeptidase [Kangiella aquimarina]
MKQLLLAAFLSVSAGLPTLGLAQEDTTSFDYYFNQNIQFQPDVVTPNQVLGNPVGEWHVRPEQSVSFFKALAQSSERVNLAEIGRTHENRPLITAYISSPENLTRLDEIKEQRKNLTEYQGPAIVWLGYSVHGNEPSGTNAALLVAYRLAASEEAWIQELLTNTIVMIDPMLNPDGMGRFAGWVNRYKGKQLVADSDSIEHNEAWPRGRTNHYWFDLNRDWLLLQHPESQARVKHFYEWRPHIVGDFHEMGTNATFFFQPGVPSRQNPLTSELNFELTEKIGRYHAKALDAIGSRYYSQESFDDFYYGKGSTFPDINGGIGILFEQASSRGHLQESVNGDVSFPFSIRNQATTSFSTLQAALELGGELLEYQRDFFQQWPAKASSDLEKGVIFSSNDEGRIKEFLRILNSHQIKVEQLAGPRKIAGKEWAAKTSYVVNFKQQQYGLIKAMFETRTEFTDNTFYDVSAWTFPLAFNLDYHHLNKDELQLLPLESSEVSTSSSYVGSDNPVALLVEWQDFRAATALTRLLGDDIDVKLLEKGSRLPVQGEPREFMAGSFTVPLPAETATRNALIEKVNSTLADLGLTVYGVDSGYSGQGADLGSPNVSDLEMPKPLLLIGEGVYSYEAGEVWHLLDTRLELPVSMQHAQDLGRIDLSDYTHLLMVSGRYPALDDKELDAVKSWIRDGGTIVATRGANPWLVQQGLVNFELLEPETPQNQNRPFSERDDARAEHIIGGAIYEANVDLSHPLAFGLELDKLAFTKAGTMVFKPATEDFVTVATYTESPLVAGYSSQTNVERIKNTPAILAQGYGRGSIIMFSDNPNFRGYWLGSMRPYINSLYFNKAL